MDKIKQSIKKFLGEYRDELVYEKNGRINELSRLTADEVLMYSDQAKWTSARWMKLERRILLIDLILAKIES